MVVARRNASGWREQNAMYGQRARLLRRLRELDAHGRLRAYFPDHAGLRDHCIDLHSKLMLVDDQLLRAGSANLNNRSLGLDTECDRAIEATGPRLACQGRTGSARPSSVANAASTSVPLWPSAASVPAAPPSCAGKVSPSTPARASTSPTSQPAALAPHGGGNGDGRARSAVAPSSKAHDSRHRLDG